MTAGRRPLAWLLVAALAPAAPGCATSWALSRGRLVFDERAAEETVPEPGLSERLEVELPQTGAADLGCSVTQLGQTRVYRAATRYGPLWTRVVAGAALAEALLATGLLLGGSDHPDRQLLGGLLAIDALGSAALALVPRRDVYVESTRPDRTVVRQDCPEGLALTVDDRPLAVDARGRLGARAAALLAERLAAGAAIGLRLGDRAVELDAGRPERCAWALRRAPVAAGPACAGVAPAAGNLGLSLDLPVGSLSGR